jgi:hypothetical protein
VDSFPPGRSFSFVAKLYAQGLVEVGAIGTISFGEQAHEPAGLRQSCSHLCLAERQCPALLALPLLDQAFGAAELGLNLSCRAGGENGVHAGTNGSEQPFELRLEVVPLVTRSRDLRRFDLGLFVCIDDGCDCRVESIRVGQFSKPCVDCGQDALFANGISRRMSGTDGTA